MQTGRFQQPAAGRIPLTAMMSVRDATHSDLPTVNRIIAESVVSWGLPERVRRLATPSLNYSETDLQHMTVVLLTHAAHGGIGVAAWEEASRLDAPAGVRAFLLHGLYIVPDYQQRGLGTKLIELAANWIRDRGYDGIAVRAWRDSSDFFAARGFVPIDRDAPADLYPRRLWKALR